MLLHTDADTGVEVTNNVTIFAILVIIHATCHVSNQSPRPCHASLRHVKLRGTRVRRHGVRLLLRHCLVLEGVRCVDISTIDISTISMVMVRCNIMDVLQALSAFIKVTIMKLAG